MNNYANSTFLRRCSFTIPFFGNDSILFLTCFVKRFSLSCFNSFFPQFASFFSSRDRKLFLIFCFSGLPFSPAYPPDLILWDLHLLRECWVVSILFSQFFILCFPEPLESGVSVGCCFYPSTFDTQGPLLNLQLTVRSDPELLPMGTLGSFISGSDLFKSFFSHPLSPVLHWFLHDFTFCISVFDFPNIYFRQHLENCPFPFSRLYIFWLGDHHGDQNDYYCLRTCKKSILRSSMMARPAR